MTDRFDLIADMVFGWIFVALGVTALVGAVAYGAWHQLLTVSACSALAWAVFKDVAEIKASGNAGKDSKK